MTTPEYIYVVSEIFGGGILGASFELETAKEIAKRDMESADWKRVPEYEWESDGDGGFEACKPNGAETGYVIQSVKITKAKSLSLSP